MEYKIIRSRRKTLALEVNTDGLIVRAPLYATNAQIDVFVNKHSAWIEKHLLAAAKRKAKIDELKPLSQNEIQVLADKALTVIPERVEYYAKKIGVTYGKITIRNQKTKWGSCSAKGNLSFNCLLMLTPPEVIDSVVVHELCHRKQMNHSDKFYAQVQRVYPEYRKWDKWLKENGGLIMKRMLKGQALNV